MRALLTGATGFVGTALAQSLKHSGSQVAAISRRGSNRMPVERFVDSWIEYEPDSAHLCREIAAYKPDVIFHLATLFKGEHTPDDIAPMIESNLHFGTQVLDAACLVGAKNWVNFTTTWEHYEQQNFNPVCLYAATKAAFRTLARFYIEARGLNFLTLEFTDTFGPGDTRPKLIPLLDRVSQSGQVLEMSPGQQLLDLLFIDDAISSIQRAADLLIAEPQSRERVFQVSSGRMLSLQEIVEIFEKTLGRKISIHWGGRPYKAREVMEPWVQGTPLPGWTPQVSLEEGLKRMFIK